MDLIFDSKILRWLTEEWDQTLDWDEANTAKLTKHKSTVEQVESLFDGCFVVGGRIVPPTDAKWSEERFILYGEADDGRRLTIVWTIRDNKIRPISCRSMRANESKIYQGKIK